MKTSKLFFGMLLAALAMGFAACSSDDDDDETPLNGKWSLLVKKGGFPSEEVNFNSGAVLCLIKGNTLTVSHHNPEDATFLPDGSYSVVNIEDRSFQINGEYYVYSIKDRQLTISKNLSADGYTYVFIEIDGK